MDLDVKCKTMKLWKRNSHRRKPSGSRVRNAKRMPKACTTHRKTDKSDLIKIKTFRSVKKRIQIQITDREKYLQSTHPTEDECPRYKELSKLKED